MGKVLGPGTLIRAKDAQVSDLLVFEENGNRATAIVFEFNDDREALGGMLEGDERPRLRRINDDELCANLGSDWLIEPDGSSDAGPGHFEVSRRAGLLVLTRSGWAMNFATSYIDGLGRFSWEWRDLGSGKEVQRVDKGLVYDRWQLWTDDKHRERNGAAPVLSHHAQAAMRND
ncbi:MULTISPECIES: hypothetical protein [unclassified Devosia]|uniref:hypothetical protein n=1 Tax=unclassified Devosia TaxID=196773 RepID=UPI0025BCC868|nr:MULTISPECIES: hypothetical protein [unclassified Devosia]